MSEQHEELIQGKVARVLNTRELVVNRGSEHGVARGMVFEVLDPAGSEIRDPDTGEVIGSVLRPKVRVRVFEVQPSLSVARTYRVKRRNVGGTGGIATTQMSALARALAPPKWVEIPETFKAEDAAWENISEEKSWVKVGDPVRQVVRLSRPQTPETEAKEQVQEGEQEGEQESAPKPAE